MFTNTYDEDKTYEDGKQYADDDKLLTRFETKAVYNKSKSDREARPIFDEVEYISIITPGSRDVFTTPLDDSYKRRFKKRYDKWFADKDNTRIEGTILAELPWLTKSQIAELNYSNIHTVEQLANLSDVNAMQFMGSHQLRDRAKKYLEATKGEAPMIQLQAALEQRDNHIQVLERKVEELTASFERMSIEASKKK